MKTKYQNSLTSELGGFMAITKHHKKWQVKVRHKNGSYFPIKSFQLKRQAERYERELISLKCEGDFSSSKLTINDYFSLWKNECRTQVSSGWLESQIQIFNKYIYPEIGHIQLNEINHRHLSCIMNNALDLGLSSQSQAHIYNTLSKMFRDAIHHFEFIKSSPLKLSLKPRVHRKERSFLKVNESWKLLNVAKNDWLGPAIWIGILTGLRPCEIQSLKWESVDLDLSRIIIKSAYCRKEKIIKPYPKQKDWGEVPIPEPLVDFLNNRFKSKALNSFVVESFNGGMLSYHSLLTGLRRLCRKAGVKRITPHEMRHSACDLYYSNGANTEDLRRLLNHASSATTMTYIHRTNERLQSIAGNIKHPDPS